MKGNLLLSPAVFDSLFPEMTVLTTTFLLRHHLKNEQMHQEYMLYWSKYNKDLDTLTVELPLADRKPLPFVKHPSTYANTVNL